jgi:hypothetical protein
MAISVHLPVISPDRKEPGPLICINHSLADATYDYWYKKPDQKCT